MVADRFAGLVLSLGLVVSTDLLAAEDTGKIAAGRVLAKGWCAACHIVSKDQRFAPAEGVPTFFAVANDPSTSETGLRVFLVSPHVVMPDFMLTRKETDDIIAYILSLRGE
jgi:mono/diheme cytochrome c family protein